MQGALKMFKPGLVCVLVTQILLTKVGMDYLLIQSFYAEMVQHLPAAALDDLRILSSLRIARWILVFMFAYSAAILLFVLRRHSYARGWWVVSLGVILLGLYSAMRVA